MMILGLRNKSFGAYMYVGNIIIEEFEEIID
jgi:hypothetical protein